ncbi:MAG: DUF5069 domain-containing protein [Opitutales bacterium]
MSNYTYQKSLQALWQKAVDLYAKGQRGADTYFNDEEQAFLDSIGATAQEVYDFAEDFNNSGDPDFATFAMLQDQRRSYFLEVQKGVRSDKVVGPPDLPPKDAATEGITWLPRIIEKAKVKLRGEMDPDLMYGCGGDRNFFRTHDIHPSEFLRVVRESDGDDNQVISWVLQRSKAQETASA